MIFILFPKYASHLQGSHTLYYVGTYVIGFRERISLGRRVRGTGISILILNTIENNVTINYCYVVVSGRRLTTITFWCAVHIILRIIESTYETYNLDTYTHNLPVGLYYYNTMRVVEAHTYF